jgi:NSS family neurotransmitter:Na+ symporter
MSSNHWSNRISFIITTSAFAVGLGNIWRFPYITGEGGGGAFLLVYLALMLLIGIPILTVEITLGRMSGTTPLLGFEKLTKQPIWNSIGWLGVLGNLLIMCYYVMIMAWVVMYMGECISGEIAKIETSALPDHFNVIASSLGTVIVVVLAILMLAGWIVNRGLQSGLERYSKWMLISLVILIIGFAIWASTLPGAIDGYRWYLSPDFTKINMAVIMSAMGQLFFSIGVGMMVAFAFGSYTSKNDNLVTSASWIVFADTFIAILAGLMLFPIIFSFGLSPDSGPDLVFVTMSSVFGKLAYGQWLGGIFFLLLFFAGFTTLISAVQGLKDSLMDRLKLPSMHTLLLILTLIFLGSIPVVFSYADEPVRLFGMRIFDFMDLLTNNIMLPLGGLLVILFGGWVIGFDKVREHLESSGGPFKMGTFWKVMVKLVIPLAVMMILLNGFLS